MVIDSSAILAVLQQEPEAAVVAQALLQGTPRRISAATFVETSIVVEARHADAGVREFDNLLHRAGIEIVPVDEVQARLAREAFRHFGKGRHQAGLNFGDCFSYALAKSLDEPLLCTGKDFRLTDLAMVLEEQGQTSSG
jgi:ribonuclease VapC